MLRSFASLDSIQPALKTTDIVNQLDEKVDVVLQTDKVQAEMMKKAVHMYASEDYVDINRIGLLRSLLRERNALYQDSATKQLKELHSKNPGAFLTEKVLSFLCQQLTLDYDLVVYRAFQSLSFKETKEMSLNNLKALRITDQLAKLEDFVEDQQIEPLREVQKQLKRNLTELNGINNNQLQKLLTVGEKVSLPTYLSTSLSLQVALDFALQDVNSVVQIIIPAGQPFWFIKEKGEFEVLLPACSSFVTLSTKEKMVRAKYEAKVPLTQQKTLNWKRLDTFFKAKDVYDNVRCAQQIAQLDPCSKLYDIEKDFFYQESPDEKPNVFIKNIKRFAKQF